jgi:peptidylprolyl isomerase
MLAPEPATTVMPISAARLLTPCLCLVILMGAGCGGDPPPPVAPSGDQGGPIVPPSAPPTAGDAPTVPVPPAGGSEDPKDHPDLEVKTLREGEGAELKAGQVAKVRYTGTLQNGREFDSSWKLGTAPATFDLSNVVKGFRLGLLGMKVGERRRIVIPGHLGYGAAGNAGAGIGSDETLIFDVELMGIESPGVPPTWEPPAGR